jgi:hypothetical protein
MRVYDAGLHPSQHVQCRMAYAWPFFTSSSKRQTSIVGAAITSIPRRFASAMISSITGSAPWAPVPTMSRLPPHGIFSSAESGVWPNFSRNCLEGLFFRFRTLPPSITTSCVYRFPSTSISPNLTSRAFNPAMFSWLELKARDSDSKALQPFDHFAYVRQEIDCKTQCADTVQLAKGLRQDFSDEQT